MIQALSNFFILFSEIEDLDNGILEFFLHALKVIKIINEKIINDEGKPWFIAISKNILWLCWISPNAPFKLPYKTLKDPAPYPIIGFNFISSKDFIQISILGKWSKSEKLIKKTFLINSYGRKLKIIDFELRERSAITLKNIGNENKEDKIKSLSLIDLVNKKIVINMDKIAPLELVSTIM